MTHRNDQIPSDSVAVTPSDTTQVDFCGLLIGTGGDVAVKCRTGGAAVVWKNMPSGAIIPCRIIQVMSTSTTATDICGFKA